MSFDFALIADSIPKMLMGIGLTFQLLFLSLIHISEPTRPY